MENRSANSIARRDFIRLAGGLAAGAMVSDSLWSKALAAPVVTGPGPYGALRAADANGIMLPTGFTSRVIARASSKVVTASGATTSYTWHRAPDGGATFATSGGGWIYLSNSEYSPGGVGAIAFNSAAQITGAYSICSGTRSNCAGGSTPWGRWLTCEEHATGNVWECNPNGGSAAIRRPALGTFKHEAAAVDPSTGFVYLTEDETDGRFYRFRPSSANNLAAGVLEVARVQSGNITWSVVPRPNPSNTSTGLRWRSAAAASGQPAAVSGQRSAVAVSSQRWRSAVSGGGQQSALSDSSEAFEVRREGGAARALGFSAAALPHRGDLVQAFRTAESVRSREELSPRLPARQGRTASR